jgi:uncharacterized membrane protein
MQMKSKTMWRRFAWLCLCAVGVFVSLHLIVMKWVHAEPFCVGAGCSRVLESALSRIGPVDTAYIGLAFYVAVIYLGSLTPVPEWMRPRRAAILTALLFAGTLVSLALQAYAIFLLRSMCVWCVCSALAVTSLLMLDVFAPEAENDRRTPSLGSASFATGLAVATSLAWTFITVANEPSPLDRAALARVTADQLLDGRRVVEPGRDRPSVVMFVDPSCPACHELLPRVLETVSQAGAGLVLRQIPHPGDPEARRAALFVESASSETEYRSRVAAYYSPLGGGATVNPSETERERADQQIQRNTRLAFALSIQRLPIVILVSKGHKRLVAVGSLASEIGAEVGG